MRLLIAALLTATPVFAADEFMEVPCLEVVDMMQEPENAALFINNGIQGVADAQYTYGMYVGTVYGYAMASGANMSDAGALGYQLGQACGDGDNLTFREALHTFDQD